jgi:Protein of unknown function (DUF3089)
MGRARVLVLGAVAAIACLAAVPSVAVAAKPVWLCKPGLEDNPCEVGRKTTQLSPAGQEVGTDRARSARRRRIDCFYVYPTVSDQPTTIANRRIDPELRSVVRYQAARYGRTCRLFAPVYRQVTVRGIDGADPDERDRGYRDVVAAWRDYLAHRNRGRGVVLIGHSQGAFHLRELIADEIDDRPKVRRRLVSALLFGGNVTVPRGSDVGGDFGHVRACRSPTQIRCVVAFSTYMRPVPSDALYGRTTIPGREVLCTNPAALAGGEGPVNAVLPREPFAPGTTTAAALAAIGVPIPASSATWLSFPDNYRAQCVSAGGANVLEITGAPPLNPVPTPAWGLHFTDANIALGDLERLVRSQARAYRGR